jgi:hypothetical protein
MLAQYLPHAEKKMQIFTLWSHKKILLKKYKNNYGVSKETLSEGRKTFMKCSLDS